MPRETLSVEESRVNRQKSGIRFNPCSLFLLGLVLLAAVSAVIALAVLFVDQNDEITRLKDIIALPSKPSSLMPSKPTSTPATTEATIAFSEISSLIPSRPTSPPATTEAPFSSENATYRLPKSIVPSHYDISIQVHLPHPTISTDISLDFTTEGSVVIDFTVTESTDVIVLHIWNLTIEGGFLIRGAKSYEILSFNEDAVRNFLVIKLVEKMALGNGYKLLLIYRGLLMSDNNGFYRSSYVLNNQTRWLAVTQFQAYKARRAFPCFDEPEFRATFDVTLKHRDVFNATFSVRKATSRKTSVENGNWVETTFQRTQIMPTYLLAFLVSDFARDGEKISDQLEFGVISRSNAIEDTFFAKQAGINMTAYLGHIMNLPYEEFNDNLNLLAVPDFDAGAMENWGLIVYREVLMLYRNGISSADDKKQVARVVAHELAHQWFGNPVTYSWWSEAFLSEGFATFFEYPVTDHVKPEWKMWDIFTIAETRVAYETDSYISSIPLYKPDVETPAHIDDMFGRITYQKGGAVFRMIDHFMGRENFFSSLRTYLAEQKVTGYTTYKILLDSFTKQMDTTEKKENMTNRFEAWITTPGFPLVTIKRNGPMISLHQERFLLGEANSSSANIWHVPITLTTSKDPTSITDSFWFDSREAERNATFEEDMVWYLANVGHYGYYRVQYDVANWQALIKQLETQHEVIDVSSRTQLVDDSFSLARKGLLSYDIPLNLSRYLPKEAGYGPWTASLEALSYISSMINVSTTKLYMTELLTGVYKESLWNTSDIWQDEIVEDYTALSLRSSWIERACFSNISSCLSDAGRFFQKWKMDENKNINPHLTKQIYCYGVRNGDQEEFDYLLSQYQSAEVHTVKLTILRGLACTPDDTLIQRLLNLTLDTTLIRSQDTSYVFQYLARFSTGAKLAWNFLKMNWEQLAKRDSMITAVTEGFNTENQFKDVETFFKGLSPDIAEKLTFESALAKIRSNIHWMEKYAEKVIQALSMQQP